MDIKCVYCNQQFSNPRQLINHNYVYHGQVYHTHLGNGDSIVLKRTALDNTCVQCPNPSCGKTRKAATTVFSHLQRGACRRWTPATPSSEDEFELEASPEMMEESDSNMPQSCIAEEKHEVHSSDGVHGEASHPLVSSNHTAAVSPTIQEEDFGGSLYPELLRVKEEEITQDSPIDDHRANSVCTDLQQTMTVALKEESVDVTTLGIHGRRNTENFSAINYASIHEASMAHEVPVSKAMHELMQGRIVCCKVRIVKFELLELTPSGLFMIVHVEHPMAMAQAEGKPYETIAVVFGTLLVAKYLCVSPFQLMDITIQTCKEMVNSLNERVLKLGDVELTFSDIYRAMPFATSMREGSF
ncbi:hypothetical protein BGW42_001744 [Actinomortierella wolfii]|nr:hypothetical protein BGW42_001744 [Actinomortierella wolfii]